MQYRVVSRKSGTLRLLIVGDILSGMPVGVIVIINKRIVRNYCSGFQLKESSLLARQTL